MPIKIKKSARLTPGSPDPQIDRPVLADGALTPDVVPAEPAPVTGPKGRPLLKCGFCNQFYLQPCDEAKSESCANLAFLRDKIAAQLQPPA